MKTLVTGLALAGILGFATPASAAPATTVAAGQWSIRVIGRDDAETAIVRIKFNGSVVFHERDTDLPLDFGIASSGGMAEVRARRTDGLPGWFECQIWYNEVMWDFAFTTDPDAEVPCAFMASS